MNFDILRFEQFWDEQQLVKLQRTFMGWDFYEGHKVPFFHKAIENPEILVQETFLVDDDPEMPCEIEVKKRFVEDFLMEGIPRMSANYIQFFAKDADNKGIVTKEGRDSYAKKYISRLRIFKEKILKSELVSDDLMKMLIQQLEILESRLMDWVEHPYPKIKQKLQFNWNKTQVVYFFQLLRVNGQIACENNRDLVNWLNNTCEYKEELPDGSYRYKPITDCRKLLSDFKTDGGHPEQPSNDFLRKVFNDDFFNT